MEQSLKLCSSNLCAVAHLAPFLPLGSRLRSYSTGEICHCSFRVETTQKGKRVCCVNGHLKLSSLENTEIILEDADLLSDRSPAA